MEEGFQDVWGFEDDLGSEEQFQPDLPEAHKAYHKNLLDRFELINQYCDCSTVEPVTFNSVNKIWFGGQDVLDYVVCYATKGDNENVPDHWHYVSFGLSDIHGYDLMEDPQAQNDTNSRTSGVGYELTFRLKAKLEGGVPPAWPVDLLQKLARYIHATPDTMIVPGDHITWHAPLHGNLNVACEINHMLVTSDASIPKIETPTGSVTFHQIVGVTSAEVEIAQQWNATALLDLFKLQEDLGGSTLVTDIFRKQSIIELCPNAKEIIQKGINRDGSDLNGVGGRALWTQNARFYCHESHWWALSEHERREYIMFESTPTFQNSKSSVKGSGQDESDVDHISYRLQHAKLLEEEDNFQEKHELPKQIRENIIYLNKVHLTLSPETAKLLPLALKGRVDHKRHFTIKDNVMDDVITFIPKGMPGSFTNEDSKFAACGPWLHILLKKESRDQISEDLGALFSSESMQPTFPKFLAWPDANLALTILDIKD